MKKPVVVHAIRGYLAGTETFVGNQIRMLQQFRPVVVAHHRSPNREFDIDDMYFIGERSNKVRQSIDALAYKGLKCIMPGTVESAARWIRQFSPALLHVHYAVDAAFFLPLMKKLKIPSVVSLYGYDISSFPNKLGGMGRRYIARMFDKVDCFLAMTNDMKHDAMRLGIREEKLLVHYHGINAERFRFDERTYEDRTQFNILCVGTLEQKKGQHHLLNAAAALKRIRTDINLKVTLVGNGPMQPDLERLVQEYGMQESVVFAGYVPHLDPRLLQYYRDADVFVHFSTTQPDYDKEGIPGTIVEAMASGLPVISTRHAGIPEAITDGTHGLLLEENNFEGITPSLLALYENRDRRRTLGRAAALRALNELDIHVKTRALERVYETVAFGKEGDTRLPLEEL